MKVKYPIKKVQKYPHYIRTLKLGNRQNSKKSSNSFKNLTIPTTDTAIISKKSKNTMKYNKTTIEPSSLTKKKIKINNHVIIKSKDKNKTNIIFRKVKTLSEKKNLHTININSNINNKNQSNNNFFRTPLRIRKNGSNGGIFKNENLKINLTEYNTNNIIDNLKKEIEFLKRENIYKKNLIENMKERIKENKIKENIMKENNELKKEIKILKIDLKKNKKIFNDINLFDKFHNDYIAKKSKIEELKQEKKILMNKIHFKKKYTNLFIRKNTEINIKSNNKINNDMNNYIEQKYKLSLNEDDINEELSIDKIDEIRYLIKMILNSNKITKDSTINLVINNLINYNEIINLLIQLLNINSPLDKKIIKKYFNFIIYNNPDKNKINFFDINNIFNEINYYYIDNISKINNFHEKEKIKNIINECKKSDKLLTGFISIDLFKNIFEKFFGDLKKKKNKDIYDTFIFIMKHNENNLKNFGLYSLYYNNLKNQKLISELTDISYIDDEEESEDKDAKICKDFFEDIFNEEKNNIICNDFVSKIFDEGLNKVKIKNEMKICADFVQNIFEESLEKIRNTQNIKVCHDFINNIFDSCSKKNK